MDIDHLKYIAYLSQTSSLTKVAEHFFTSHQVVRKAIAKVEDELQVSLLQSTNQGTKLTPAGLYVAEYAKSFLRQYDDLTNGLQAFRSKTTPKMTELNIYVVPGMANNYYLDLFDSFFEQNSHIKQVLHVSTFPQMLKETQTTPNNIYLSIIPHVQKINSKIHALAEKYQLKTILFNPIFNYVCMHKKSKYAKLAFPSLTDLKNATIYVFLNTNPLCFSNDDLSSPFQYFSDYNVLKRNIKKHNAVAIIRKTDYEYYFGKENSEYILRPLNDFKIQYALLASEENLTKNPDIQNFIHFLHDEFGKFN